MPDSSFRDDQGTRVGSPRRNQSEGATGAGGEAAEGIHSADAERDPSEQSAIESQPTGRETGGNEERSGSEPLVDRETEHRSGYGGSAGRPVRSSDQREATGSPEEEDV